MPRTDKARTAGASTAPFREETIRIITSQQLLALVARIAPASTLGGGVVYPVARVDTILARRQLTEMGGGHGQPR